jgi:hypothetical protein
LIDAPVSTISPPSVDLTIPFDLSTPASLTLDPTGAPFRTIRRNRALARGTYTACVRGQCVR